MNSRLADIDLHDGQIRRTVIDYETRSIVIELTYYATMDDKDRRPATLTFTEVDIHSSMVDAFSIVDNANAGNISHWQPAEGRGTTFIYLVGGTIAIMARSLNFTDRQ